MPADAESRLAVDTSVAVPLLVQVHPQHDDVARWRRRHGRPLALSGHALAETYSVLTRLPPDLRVTAAQAEQVLASRFVEPLPVRTSRRLIQELAACGIVGGAVYDALVALAAREAGTRLATRDARALATYRAIGVDVEVVTG